MTGGVAPFIRACQRPSIPSQVSQSGNSASIAAFKASRSAIVSPDHCERRTTVAAELALGHNVLTQYGEVIYQILDAFRAAVPEDPRKVDEDRIPGIATGDGDGDNRYPCGLVMRHSGSLVVASRS
jgi:hypothetical protein